MDCEKQHRDNLATFMFQGEAEHLWKLTKRILVQIEDSITWKCFLEKFNDKCFPNFIRQQKDVEFMTLTLDTMTVAQQEAKFVELARYWRTLVSEAKRKACIFERRLKVTIQHQFPALHLQTYEEVYKTALFVKKYFEETQQY